MKAFFVAKVLQYRGNGTNVPFGEITGYASTNVPAYSNGNDSYISEEYHFLYEVYVGMKCNVWSMHDDGFSYVKDVFLVMLMERLICGISQLFDKRCFTRKPHPNGSPSPPQNQSLLIYMRQGIDIPFGHVSVVVDVLPGYIRVTEENCNAYYWSEYYSRQIPYVLRNRLYYIEDDYPIFGWMTVEDDKQLKPLDQSTIDQIIRLNGASPDFICRNSANYFSFLM